MNDPYLYEKVAFVLWALLLLYGAYCWGRDFGDKE